MLDSEFQHNFHTHTFRCKHAKGEWLGRITTLFPPREKYPGSSRLAAVPVSPSEHVLCARKFWLND
jgi:hypothetical protein